MRTAMREKVKTPVRTERDDRTAEELRALVAEYGAAGAARLLGMRRDTIVALLSNTRVMPGSFALLREKLAARAAEQI